MAWPFSTYNPGFQIGGQLTSGEISFVQNLEGLSYSTGDILYYDGASLTNLGAGTNGQVLTLAAGIPSWATVTGTGDMQAATYDPNSVGGDAFLMSNMNGTAHRMFYTDGSGDIQELAHGTSGQVLKSNGATSAPSWQSDDVTVSFDVNQTTHGFSVGDWVRHNGTSYTEAQADTAANAESVGIVSAVADVDNFTLTQVGHVTGLSGLTAGTVYFLDPSTAGAQTATEPTTESEVSKPVLVADSTTSGWILNYRGAIVGTDSNVLDGTPDTDHTANGPQTDTFQLSGTIGQIQSVYMNSSGQWAQTDASAESTSAGMLALTLESGVANDPVLVALKGSFIRDDSFTFTAGQTIYLSTTAGAWTATEPTGSGDISRVVGYCVAPDVVYFDPSPEYLVIA